MKGKTSTNGRGIASPKGTARNDVTLSAPVFDHTHEQRADWEDYQVELGTVVGVAVEVKENGTKVIENERLKNGLCRLRLQRYGKAPEVPVDVPVDVTVMRWTDEELPIHYLYAFWMEAE